MNDIPSEFYDMAAAMIHNYDVSSLPENKQRAAVRLIDNNDEGMLATMLYSIQSEGNKLFREGSMKISKQQLKKIIKEEKQKLLQEFEDVYSDGDASNQSDMELEKAVYGMLDAIMVQNCLQEAEAADIVLEHVRNILGM